MPIEKRKLCFVLMPFKEELKDIYWKAIKPACDKAGFMSLRVDELKGTYNINRKIIEHIFKSDVIVADLTEWNPNVFYELGVAHAIDNKTIMIIQKKDKLPFDVSNYRCIQYDQTEAELEKLTESILESLMSLEEWRLHPTNPVQDFKPPDAVAPKSILEASQRELIQKQAEILTLQQEVNRLHSELADKSAILRSQKPAIGVQLRSQPATQLSDDEVKKMLEERDFFDSDWNKKGYGLHHQYELIERHGKKLVIDHTTGLIWQQSGSENHFTFQSAQVYVQQLNTQDYGGYNNWRLPTLEEAMSLMEQENKNGDLYIDPVFDQMQKWMWTIDKKSAAGVWVIDFYYGNCNHDHVDYDYYVRAVR